MPEPLRPMSTGELLDRTFVMYKRNFLLFAGIILPAPAIILGLNMLEVALFKAPAAAAQTNPALALASVSRILWGSFAMILAWIFGISITHAATVRAVSAVHLSRTITVRQAYSALKGRFFRIIGIVFCLILALIGAGALSSLVAGLVSAVGIGVAAAGGPAGKIAGIAIAGVAFLCALVLIIWIMARYALAVQACVIEDTKIFQSLRRSAALAKGSIFRIVVVYLLLAVVAVVVALTLQYGLRFATLPFHSFYLTALVQAIAAFISGVITGPLVTVALSLVYYDERVRKEAFDLQLMMAALDGPQASTVAAS